MMRIFSAGKIRLRVKALTIFPTDTGLLSSLNQRVFDFFGLSSTGYLVLDDGRKSCGWSLQRKRRTYALWDIMPDTPITATLLDSNGTQLDAVDFELSPGEERSISLNPKFPVRPFQGKVLDQDGKPPWSAIRFFRILYSP